MACVLAIGGHDGSADLDSVEVYKHDDPGWALASGGMNTLRSAVGAAEFNGRVFVAGGSSGTQLGHTEVESFTVVEKEESPGNFHCHWQHEPALDQPRMACSLVLCKDTLWALGGFHTTTTDGVEYLSSDRASWITAHSMSTPRCSFGAVEMLGSIFALGGFGRSEEGALSSCEMLDIRVGAWKSLPSMFEKRSCFAAAAASPHRIMVCGGHDGQRAKAEVEVYDLIADRWDKLPSMPTPRSGAAAATLKENVCVVGGYPDGFADHMG